MHRRVRCTSRVVDLLDGAWLETAGGRVIFLLIDLVMGAVKQGHRLMKLMKPPASITEGDIGRRLIGDVFSTDDRGVLQVLIGGPDRHAGLAFLNPRRRVDGIKGSNLASIWPAVQAGVGITLGTSYWVPEGLLAHFSDGAPLPAIAEFEVMIHYNEAALLAEIPEVVHYVQRSAPKHEPPESEAAALLTAELDQ